MKLLKKLLEISQKAEEEKLAAGLTDVGQTRSINEDYFAINRDKNLFIVADGMGGHNAGDIASKNATQKADSYLTPELLEEIKGNIRKTRETIIKSLLHAHLSILKMAEKNDDYEGMGCTIVTALIVDNSMHLCHVGDARAYLSNKNGITLLTRDHSYVMDLVTKGKLTLEEARVSPLKNKLHQAIGASKTINPDYKHCELREGDKILLCSDGLWDMLSDHQIFTVMRQDKPPKRLCEILIKMANDAGGHDNITAIILQHKERLGAPRPTYSGDTSVVDKTGEYSFVFKNPSPDEDERG